ncbi:MAG: hypothetical protein QXU20_00800 [Candidatus Woesearchaeota archaeon]
MKNAELQKPQNNIKPETKLRAGSIEVTIWNNKTTNKNGEEKSYKTITAQRIYKAKDGTWKNTNSYKIRDIPYLVALLNKAYENLVLREK